MIARVKKDLIDLFEHIDHGNHNKYWRKMLSKNGRYLPPGHKEMLYNAAEKVKLCNETINMIKNISSYNNDSILTSILQCPDYTDVERGNLYEKYKDDIDWYVLWKFDKLDFDVQVQYYPELQRSYSKNRDSYNEPLEEKFKDIEREYKINSLLE